MRSKCTIPDCGEPHYRAQLWCNKHYRRWLKHGDPTHTLHAFRGEGFWSRVRKTSACWFWLAPLHNGYGKFWTGERNEMAHRFAYELLVGPIPDGLTIDHLCRNRSCVNPDHLEPVTTGVNVMRGIGFAPVNALKTHCPQGHAYDLFNTRRSGKKQTRFCRTCDREKHRTRRQSADLPQ